MDIELTFSPLHLYLLPRQCIQIYGVEQFGQIYDFLRRYRYASGAADEKAIMDGLRKIVPNVRDCFLVDQLVFLEKQAESVEPL